jgi:type I restriction enzyme R subunit
VARDIVQHFLGRGFQGKAMVVSIDKITALRTFAKVRRAWQAETERVEARLGEYGLPDSERAALAARRARLREVDMALIVSPGQNEIEEMRKRGLDIVPHRKRMNEEALDEKFKDPKDPLSLVFVCAMWLTGFDAPSCSTVYLDKPMRNHSLMQTIARANRVHPGKQSGVIVDYANVFDSLERALALYAVGGRGKPNLQNKDALVDELRAALAELDQFCQRVGVRLAEIVAARDAMARLQRLSDAANRLVAPDETRKAYLLQARLADRLYAALKPHRRASEFAARMATVAALAEKVREATAPPQRSLDEVLAAIGRVLDGSIVGAAGVRDAPPPVDLSRIDFQLLSKRFEESSTKNLDLERMKAAIAARLDALVQANETRVDFKEKFEALIADYNAGSMQIEQAFQALLKLSQGLDEEAARHVREQLTEEELVIFDLLTRPGPDLSSKERDQVKKVAREMLATVRGALRLDWGNTVVGQAKVREVIADVLDAGLPEAYDRKLFEAKSSALFQHVYERYQQAA